jgi:hypothetical protein
MLLLVYILFSYLLFRVLLCDPREATKRVSSVLIWGHVGLVGLPLIISPQSAYTRFFLALAISVSITPLIFSAMRTFTIADWIGDKITIAALRFGVALLLMLPLSYFANGWWVMVLFGLGVGLFYMRLWLWITSGGRVRDYLLALVGACVVGAGLSIQADNAGVTPANWFKLFDHLPRTDESGIE